MIVGRNDTWFTIEEFARMIEREPKTVQNWISEGRFRPCRLYGVPLISLRTIENMIEGYAPEGADEGRLAAKLSNRVDGDGKPAVPERHRRRGRSAQETSFAETA